MQDLLRVLPSNLTDDSLLLAAEEPLRALIPFDRCALMLPFTDRVGQLRTRPLFCAFRPRARCSELVPDGLLATFLPRCRRRSVLPDGVGFTHHSSLDGKSKPFM
jgi:hypothetical protein